MGDHQTRDRVDQNIEGLQEWIDSADERKKQERIKDDLEFITSALDTFQSKYESVDTASELINSCSSGLNRVKQALGNYDELYLGLSSAVVHNAQGMLVAVVNKEQEDFGHVSTPGQLQSLLTTVKRANAVMQKLNSLDMVAELRQQFNTNKNSLSQMVSQLESLQAQAQRQSSNSGGNCYIATMAYGSYDHPQVIELRKFRDTILSEYQAGKFFIKLYYRYSPGLVNALENRQFANKAIRSLLNLFIRIIK